MFTIEYLKKEHEIISKLTDRIEEKSIDVIDGKEVDTEFFRNAIYFIRKFADKEHHKKEEDILFKYMMLNLGTVAEKLIKNGMLVEHDMARFYVYSLEEYLNLYEKEKTSKNRLYIITNAMNYAELLRRHIEKENTAVYTFGEKNLSEDILKIIDEEMKIRVEEESQDLEEKTTLMKKLNI